jgi:hypothetical protein
MLTTRPTLVFYFAGVKKLIGRRTISHSFNDFSPAKEDRAVATQLEGRWKNFF